jgi:peptidoglycan/xylan/chitin deacetylase (PgdA/CDA1 family)
MDQEWFDYSPFPFRKPLSWPDGARVALWISVALECMDPQDPDEWSALNIAVRSRPDVRTASEVDYGNAVGFWRVVEALDRHGLRGTAAIDALTARRYPSTVKEARKQGWEIIAHGEVASRVITDRMPADEERALIARSRDAIAEVTGSAPAGWLSPGVSESTRTPGLLADAGFTYVADFCNDDQPYRINLDRGTLTALPYSIAVNDFEVLLEQHHTPWEFEEAGEDHFDDLYEQARSNGSGMVMCIALHPFCIGQPFRIKYLEQMLAHITSYAGVWNATAGEIVECYENQVGT